MSGAEKAGSPITFLYEFVFPDGRKKEFRVELDSYSYQNIGELPPDLPDWTDLGFCQCPNCPLPPTAGAHCPPAARLIEIIHGFSDSRSFEKVDVRVEGRQRAYFRATDVQTGVSALMGLVMATSGCPVLDRLRPMVATHLPFMSDEESTYRILGTYLLAQYFRARRGEAPDWALESFGAFFAEIQAVNRGFLERLRAVSSRDASANAVVILDNLGAMASLTIARERLDRLERLFAAAPGEPS